MTCALPTQESDETVLSELLTLMPNARTRERAARATAPALERAADGEGASAGPPARAAATAFAPRSVQTLSHAAEATILSAIEAWRLDRDDAHDTAAAAALRALRDAIEVAGRAFGPADAPLRAAEAAGDADADVDGYGDNGRAAGARVVSADDAARARAVRGTSVESHALRFLRLFELEEGVHDETVVAELSAMFEPPPSRPPPPPVLARLVATVALHRHAVASALACEGLMRTAARILAPIGLGGAESARRGGADNGADDDDASIADALSARESDGVDALVGDGNGGGTGAGGSGAGLDEGGGRGALDRFVRDALSLWAAKMPADATPLEIARELLAIGGYSPRKALPGPRASARAQAAGHALLAIVASELGTLRAAGAIGRVAWPPELSSVPFGSLAPLRASALLRACAPSRDGSSASPPESGALPDSGFLGAEQVARCDATEFALALGAALRAAGAAVRLLASCEAGSAAGAQVPRCFLVTQVHAPLAPAELLGAGAADAAGCSRGWPCELALLPAALLPQGARAAREVLIVPSCRDGPPDAPAGATTGGHTAAPDGSSPDRLAPGDVWISLEWGAQAPTRIVPAATGAEGKRRPIWLVPPRRADSSSGARAPRALVHLWDEAMGKAHAAEAEEGAATRSALCAQRVWLACEGCVAPVGDARGAEADVCVCRVERDSGSNRGDDAQVVDVT